MAKNEGSERHPRPEAVALRWADMLGNTRRATEELIDWLISATRVSQSKRSFAQGSPPHFNEQLATSVLVAGDRGFGKTTVLLSAAQAFQDPEAFIPRPSEPSLRNEEAEALRQRLMDYQKSIVWLDPLDLEPIPSDANLLATLLVRVQGALRPGKAGRDGERTNSALLAEEGLDEPWEKIDPLVREATFMWEKSPAQGLDAREHAANQIKAADIYATFQNSFFEAIDSVAHFLALRRFGRGSQKQVILVLPIDNVDRSIQHLHLILKLIRMVASPRLWFLLASGRAEFQLFLERTFQKELTESGELLQSAELRDASMSIARRQAAGAMRRVLPQVHRIEIKPLTPRRIWEFRAPRSVLGDSEDTHCIRDFLRRIPVPGTASGVRCPAPEEQDQDLGCLSDLFDVRKRLSVRTSSDDELLLKEYIAVLSEQDEYEAGSGEVPRTPDEARRALLELRERFHVGDTEELLLEELVRVVREQRRGEPMSEPPEPGASPLFTHAARLALSMSARTALDFWQEARKAAQDAARDRDVPLGRRGQHAIDLAYRMLCMAIDESELPSWASEQLLHRVLRQDAQKRVFLDLTQDPVRRLKLTTLSDALDWPEGKKPPTANDALGRALRSELHLRHVMDIILVLQDLDVPGRGVHLPANVAGWYMLLHDLLVLTSDGRVLTQRVVPFDVTPQLVVTRHEALLSPHQLVELNFRWLLPEWDTFIDSFLFTMQWKAFLHAIRGLFVSGADRSPATRARPTMDHFRLILAAWIDSVCAVAGEHRGQWTWEKLRDVLTPRLGDPVLAKEEAVARLSSRKLDEYEASVIRAARSLYQKTQDDLIRFGRPCIARHWLESFLPLLMGPEFMPPDATRGFRERMRTERGPRDISTFDDLWDDRAVLLHQRRYELVRDEVKMSTAYAQQLALYNGTSGLGARACARWLEQACDAWFAAPHGEGSR